MDRIQLDRGHRALGRSVLALCCALALSARAAAGELHLVLLHTNDVHGQVLPRPATWQQGETDPPTAGGLPRVAAYVERVRREHAGPDRAVVVVDAGDWYQGTPEGALDVGLGFVQALAAVGYDAAAIGNHDFDHGLDNARRLVTEGGLPAVCANLTDPETGAAVDWIEPWRIVERGGLRIAFVGLVTATTPEISHPETRTGIVFEDPVLALGRARERLAALPDPPDLVVPVTHLGLEDDRSLARAFPDVPLIVGGHLHRFLPEGLREGDTLIVQAGARASVVGRVDLVLDAETGAVQSARAQLVEIDSEPAPEDQNAAVEERCRVLAEQAEKRMSTVVGELTAPLERRSGLRTSPACAWVADAMRRRTGAGVALHNRGGVRCDLPAGPITRRMLFELVPFDNDLVTMDLTGAQLEACLTRALNGSHKGLDASGATFACTVDEEDVARLAEVLVAGEPLEPERVYRVTTNSFLANGGDGYTELEQGARRVVDPIYLRDMLALDVLAAERVVPPTDERLRVLAGAR